MPRLLQPGRLAVGSFTSSSRYFSMFCRKNQHFLYNKFYCNIKSSLTDLSSRLFCLQIRNCYVDRPVSDRKQNRSSLKVAFCQNTHFRYYYPVSFGFMAAAFSTSSEYDIHNGDCLNIPKKENTANAPESTQTNRSDRLIWMDLEMTGLDFVNDRILEIACLVTEKDLQVVAEGPHIIVHESDEVLNNMGDWCKKNHGQSGLTEAVRRSKIRLTEAEQMLLDFVRKHTPKGMCPLAGNTVGMDRGFILCHMPQLAEHLHYRVVDVSTVKELCRRWFPDKFQMAPVKQEKHRSMDDILESIAELKFYRSTIFK